MFSSSKREGRGAAASGMPSIIAANLRLTGNITGDGDLQVEGTVDGDVTCRSMTVGAKATVTGTIECETARVCGKVKGKIKARTVILAPSAHVVGDILHDRIAIETGAYFEGSLKHIDASRPPVNIVTDAAGTLLRQSDSSSPAGDPRLRPKAAG
jgi:cytoskeletal protein CcmA (bactofilin family)